MQTMTITPVHITGLCIKYTEYALLVHHNTNYGEKTEKGRRKNDILQGVQAVFLCIIFIFYATYGTITGI